MNDYLKTLNIQQDPDPLRDNQVLWKIVKENLHKTFTVGMCVAISRMASDKILTYPEADHLRKELEKDRFWAAETEDGALCFWEPGNIEKRYEYLNLKIRP